MNQQSQILIVDDEPQIARVLRSGLGSHGFAVRVASSGSEAVRAFAELCPDLVITDLGMPEMSGVELCRIFRAESAVPIIVLSVRGEESSKVEALDAGADDYVTKPFGMDELLARVRATLRRARAAPLLAGATSLGAGDLHVDVEAHTATLAGRAVHLTPKEFELLVFMMRHAGRVLTHAMLLRAVWGGGNEEQVEYLRVFVGHLRKKIEPDPSRPRYIVTEPWIGYRFDPGP
jgi:two-component system, OmpR family, KDP operon response regulator KdpE